MVVTSSGPRHQITHIPSKREENERQSCDLRLDLGILRDTREWTPDQGVVMHRHVSVGIKQIIHKLAGSLLVIFVC